MPLKTTAGAPDPGDGLHPARDDDALREIERALSRLARREERWQLYERLAARRGALRPGDLRRTVPIVPDVPAAPDLVGYERSGGSGGSLKPGGMGYGAANGGNGSPVYLPGPRPDQDDLHSSQALF